MICTHVSQNKTRNKNVINVRLYLRQLLMLQSVYLTIVVVVILYSVLGTCL